RNNTASRVVASIPIVHSEARLRATRLSRASPAASNTRWLLMASPWLAVRPGGYDPPGPFGSGPHCDQRGRPGPRAVPRLTQRVRAGAERGGVDRHGHRPSVGVMGDVAVLVDDQHPPRARRPEAVEPAEPQSLGQLREGGAAVGPVV